MDTNTNYFYKILNYFYKPNKLIHTNPVYKYTNNLQNSIKYTELPLLFTNPKWDSEKKKLIFNSIEYEIELQKNRSKFTNNFYLHNSILWDIYYPKNKYSQKVIFGNPKWNYLTGKLEWNITIKK